MYRNLRTEVTHLPHCLQEVQGWPLPESLSELRPGVGGEDWGMEMGMDTEVKNRKFSNISSGSYCYCQY